MKIDLSERELKSLASQRVRLKYKWYIMGLSTIFVCAIITLAAMSQNSKNDVETLQYVSAIFFAVFVVVLMILSVRIMKESKKLLSEIKKECGEEK